MIKGWGMRLGLNLGSGGGGAGGYSAEAEEYFAAMGTPFTGTKRGAVATFIDTLVSSGLWAKADKIGLFCTPTKSDAFKNLKQPNNISTDINSLGVFQEINTVEHTPFSGLRRTANTNGIVLRYKPDGVSQTNWTLTSASMLCYAYTPPLYGNTRPMLGAAANGYASIGYISAGSLGAFVNSSNYISAVKEITRSTMVGGAINNGTLRLWVGSTESTGSVSAPNNIYPASDMSIASYLNGTADTTQITSFIYVGGGISKSAFTAIQNAVIILLGVLNA